MFKEQKENKYFRLRKVPKNYTFQFIPCICYNTRFMDCMAINWNSIIWGYWEVYFHGKERKSNA